MSDLIEKIAEAIRDVHAPNCKTPSTFQKEMAKAALSVIKENAGDLVKPLEWAEHEYEEGGIRAYRTNCINTEYTIDCDYFCAAPFCLFVDDEEIESFKTAGEAKAAAQQHHTARVLSLLNLEVE